MRLPICAYSQAFTAPRYDTMLSSMALYVNVLHIKPDLRVCSIAYPHLILKRH